MTISFYFLNILASPDVLIRLTTNGHHQKTTERTWHMVNGCTETEQEYTGGNSISYFGQPYLLTTQFNPKIFK